MLHTSTPMSIEGRVEGGNKSVEQKQREDLKGMMTEG